MTYVVDGSGGNIYVDGSFKYSLAWTGTAGAPTSTESLKIGRYGNNTSSPNAMFKGNIDEVRLYNRALTATEVVALYNAEKP